MKSFVACGLSLLIGLPAIAQSGVEEIVVTASRAESPRPGTYLRKTGDFILLRVAVSNDTREPGSGVLAPMGGYTGAFGATIAFVVASTAGG